MIGFVIPSIGRPTLTATLNSLLYQTNSNWKCYVGFDGKKEFEISKSILVDDSRIKYFYFGEKLGSEKEFHGNAGQVRNAIIRNLDPEIDWIGFVDDDDTLSKYYTEILELEKTKSNIDCCVFRMRYDKDNQKIVPPFGMNYLMQNYVGISFSVRRKFIEYNNILFENDNAEDFMFLKSISDNQGKIYISSHVTYNVNGYEYHG